MHENDMVDKKESKMQGADLLCIKREEEDLSSKKRSKRMICLVKRLMQEKTYLLLSGSKVDSC